jgi:hypothetical protein
MNNDTDKWTISLGNGKYVEKCDLNVSMGGSPTIVLEVTKIKSDAFRFDANSAQDTINSIRSKYLELYPNAFLDIFQ